MVSGWSGLFQTGADLRRDRRSRDQFALPGGKYPRAAFQKTDSALPQYSRRGRRMLSDFGSGWKNSAEFDSFKASKSFFDEKNSPLKRSLASESSCSKERGPDCRIEAWQSETQGEGIKSCFCFFAANMRERPMTDGKGRRNFLFALEGGDKTGKLRKKEESR